MTDLDGFADGWYTAVVDTVEDGLVTVFFEKDGEEVASTVLDVSALPATGRQADTVLSARVDDGAVVEWTVDLERTNSRAEQAQNRFDSLSIRPPSDDES